MKSHRDIQGVLGRTLPTHLEAEKAVLAAVLLNDDRKDIVKATL